MLFTLTVLKKNVSLVASSLDREVEKPGYGSWVLHSLAEDWSAEPGDLSPQMEQIWIILFSNWTPCGIQLDFIFLIWWKQGH